MNITLRPWREADAAACAVLADDEGVAASLRDVFPHPYTEQDARDFIALCLAADPDEMLSCVVEVEGAFAGSISLTRGAAFSVLSRRGRSERSLLSRLGCLSGTITT